MKKSLPFFTLAILISLSTLAQTITQSYTFDRPQFIEKSRGYTEALIDGCLSLGEEGMPLLPHYSAELLLPQGHIIKNIEVVSVTYSESVTGINLIPASRPFPISEPAPAGYFPEENRRVYGSTDPFPARPTGNFSTQKLGGYHIGVFTILPLQFMPQQQAVRYIEEITLNIETAPAENNLNAGFSESAAKRMQSIVDNPEAISTYHFSNLRNGDEADLLLISSQELMDAFAGYIDYKIKRGFIVNTITTEEILVTYTGADDAEKVRNCIIDQYENYGIQYVLLGGDSDGNNPAGNIVPHRGFYINNGYGTTDDHLPSDMYFACLDGNWDTDGDGKYGEPGEEDLFAEISVGRISGDSGEEIANALSKLIKYQDTPVMADVEKALMVGESLDETTWGGDSKECVALGSSAHGYTTAGFSDNFTLTRLYEKEDYWNKNDIFHEFSNHGCHLLNHLGHSNVTYNMKLNNSDLTVANLSNDGVSRSLVIGYSQGCYNGAFDNRNSNFTYQTDCFTEEITTMPTGMVASIGNSRYGWYQKNTTNGASQYLDRQFFDAIFGEDITEIGWANGDSREDNTAYILENMIIRWCAYEVTVFGDPSMDIWTAAPTEFSVNHPMAVEIGGSTISFATGAPFARIGLMQDGELIGRGVADESGNLDLELFDPLSINEPIDVTITAHNKLVYQETIAVISDEAYVMFNGLQINDENGNANGEADYGETLLLGLTLTNVGNQPAQDVTVTLSSGDPYIALPYLAVEFGDFEVGESKTISNAFEVIIAGNIPDQHEIDIDVHANGGEEWISDFDFDVNAPVLKYVGYTMDETGAGNGNDLPDPGETLNVYISLENSGHALSPALSSSLAAGNDLVTVVTATYDHPAMAPGASGALLFSVLISEEASMGDPAELNLQASAGEYLLEQMLIMQTAMPVEDFETAGFNSFDWTPAGDLPWEIATGEAWHGDYSIRSGAIDHSQTSEIKTTVLCTSLDTISFWFKTSSESGYDFLNFYIDMIRAGQWSGDSEWQKVSFAIYPGTHTFRWVYQKDEYMTGGEDCAWIDFIEFPMIMQSSLEAGDVAEICSGDGDASPAQGQFINNILWETSGDGTFSNAGILSPEYIPGAADVATGMVTLSVSATDMMNNGLTDELLLMILATPAVPAQPEGDTAVCSDLGMPYDYTIPQVSTATGYSWQLIPEECGTITAADTAATVLWSDEYEGLCELRVRAVNDCGESPYSEILLIQAQLCSGIAEAPGQQLTVQPNPGSGFFSIEIPATEQNLHLQVFGSDGRLITQQEINSHNGKISLDLTGRNAGVYYLMIRSENRTRTEKVVVR